MTIHSEIQFEKVTKGEIEQRTLPLADITFENIEAEMQDGATALIINTFEGSVPLSEMVESTADSIAIMEAISHPIDILAIMKPRSSLSMSITDIRRTASITDFTTHPKRGVTIAVLYEKSVTKFFLTLANQLLPNANFIVADSLEDAHKMLAKYRTMRTN